MYRMGSLWFLPAALILLKAVTADRDPSVCMERPANGGPQIPALPNVFQAYVECNMVDLGYTVAVMEYYDGVRNRGAILSEAHGSTRTVVYDFPNDEAFVIIGSTCQTQKASDLSMSQLGLFGVNTGNGTAAHIYSVNQVFHFGPQVSLFYEGTAEVRGIPVQWWSTCQYLADLDVTFFGQYYFTLPGYQSAAYSLDDVRNPIPVRINVTGKTGSFPQRHINHLYEFSQFRADIDPGAAAFETPPHVYCGGRQETVPLPPVPEVFSFHSEVVTPNNRLIGNFKEWFDTADRVARYDTKPASGSAASSSDPISTVDDFATGLSYRIDRRTGGCVVSPVRNDTGFTDGLPVDPLHVRMTTAEEFFHFDNTSWAYVGEVDVGGLPCMRWIGLREDYPPNNPIQTTWEWSFAQPGWTSALPSSSDVTSQSFPVMLEVRGVHRKDFSFSYSFSMFSEFVDVSDFDIVSQCFTTAQKNRVQIIFPGQFPADLNVNWFRTALKKGVASAAQVESLRVTDIQIDRYGSQLVAEATLLDAARVAGDVLKPVAGVTMAEAFTNLRNSVQRGDLRFLVPIGHSDFNRVPVRASFVREVGVHSTVAEQVTYTKGSVRLVGGRTAGQLQLERTTGVWGGVCSSGWGAGSARVACRQLGYDGASQATYCVDEPVSPRAARTTPQSWLYGVQCAGTEESILACPNSGWRPAPCDGAGVVCIDTVVPATTPSASATDSSSPASPAAVSMATPPASTADTCDQAPSTTVTYSTGVLAGTAAAMLVLGGVIGNGVGFLVRRRMPELM
ncbi:DMBT1 [Branchiostoma lanceolatum]|uniref:DMBT1 protein n=1 Tax=Branchiostoma lanceolatum TaxID=7740 RepID=A0A8J9VWN4_BRALA|nr:DMBT1 [Branchiostoma lanceolatum]